MSDVDSLQLIHCRSFHSAPQFRSISWTPTFSFPARSPAKTKPVVVLSPYAQHIRCLTLRRKTEPCRAPAD